MATSVLTLSWVTFASTVALSPSTVVSVIS